jgi:hypothetical protein
MVLTVNVIISLNRFNHLMVKCVLFEVRTEFAPGKPEGKRPLGRHRSGWRITLRCKCGLSLADY